MTGMYVKYHLIIKQFAPPEVFNAAIDLLYLSILTQVLFSEFIFFKNQKTS